MRRRKSQATDPYTGRGLEAGTRVPIEEVAGRFSAGDTVDEIATDFGRTRERSKQLSELPRGLAVLRCLSLQELDREPHAVDRIDSAGIALTVLSNAVYWLRPEQDGESRALSRPLFDVCSLSTVAQQSADWG